MSKSAENHLSAVGTAGMSDKLLVRCAPHVRDRQSTARIMWTVFACLLPAGFVSAFVFGPAVFQIIAAAVFSAVAAEWGWCLLRRTPLTINDGSVWVTGLLLAYNLPARSPLWLAVLGAVVAVIFGKLIFGGLGYNIFNPALVGRVFLMAAFPTLMTRWPQPFSFDALTAPTPLAVFKDGFSGAGLVAPETIIDYSYWDLFLGMRGGCIGEASGAALLVGAVILLLGRYITWHIPISFITTTTLLIWICGGSTWFSGDVLLHLFSGGLMLGAWYMATDYTTTPMTRQGQLLFGCGCGLLTAIIRLWGGYPEGVSYAILLMNAVSPLIDRFVRPRRFGVRPI